VAEPLDGKRVAQDCRSATGLAPEVVLGLNFVPDETDVQNLEFMFSGQELTREEFLEFCASRGLVPDPANLVSAARFVAFACGQPLAWLHFPAEAIGLLMARSVWAWVAGLGYVICTGQGGTPLSQTEMENMWAG